MPVVQVAETTINNPEIFITIDSSLVVSGKRIEFKNNLDRLITNLLLVGEKFSFVDIKSLFDSTLDKNQDALIRCALRRAQRNYGELFISDGNTRGKTYRLSEAAQILDKRPSYLPIEPRASFFIARDQPNSLKAKLDQKNLAKSAAALKEHKLSYEDRAAFIDQNLQRYKDNQRVKKAIYDYQEHSTSSIFHENSFSQYVNQIIKYSLLTAEDEQVLFGAIDQGLSLYSIGSNEDLNSTQEKVLVDMVIAYNKIYFSNLRLVIAVNKSRFNRRDSSIDPLDYIQEGNMALGFAIKRFEVSMGYKFSTYAAWWLKQKSQRAQIKYARSIYIPHRVHEDWVKVNRAEDELVEDLKRKPTLSEIGQAINRTSEQVSQIIQYGIQDMVSLDEPLGTVGHDDIGDTVASSAEEDFQQDLVNRDMVKFILDNAELTQAELLHISLRFHIFIDSLASIKLQTENGPQDYAVVFKNIKTDKIMTYDEMQRLTSVRARNHSKMAKTLMQKINKRMRNSLN